tara:strand:- start:20003 stop:21421 length:1419 start_codon:yes stop_codon:yes gene_type:complete
METIPNILAERYTSAALKEIWSAPHKILLERKLWIAVMKAQQDLGIDIPSQAIQAYEQAQGTIDLDAIRQREAITRHDVKARIDVFCALAGHEYIHKGLTSRDLTDTVEQLQVLKSLEIIREKCVSALLQLSEHAQNTRSLLISARTHNVPAQPTTLGRRFAMFGEELLHALQSLDSIIAHYPIRGIKGAVGNQLDMLHLFKGDLTKVAAFNEKLLEYLGISQSLNVPGQVYPRSLDFEVVSILNQCASGPTNMAKTLRLMAGHSLVNEGFEPGQVGSSAMPHKKNSRSCERIQGLNTLLKGYLTMANTLCADQWNEGDVSCSVVRRVMLPDSFFAMDGLLETFLYVLKNLEVCEEAITQENDQTLPYLLTGVFMAQACAQGLGREEAHERIKEHALASLGTTSHNQEHPFLKALGSDSQLGLSPTFLQEQVINAKAQLKIAETQIESFLAQLQAWQERFPQARAYVPQKCC